MRSTLIYNVDGLQLSYLGSEPASSLYPCPVRGKEQQFKVEQLIKSRSRHASQQKADRHIDDKGCLWDFPGKASTKLENFYLPRCEKLSFCSF
jgi:hypothetical protein